MTPQPPAPVGGPDNTTLAGPHLTEEQFGDLLSRPANSPIDIDIDAHLRACEPCAQELADLRESITFFREASTAYADRELRLIPRWRMPRRTHVVQPVYLAAAAILLISLVPMQMARRHSLSPKPAVAASASAVAAPNNQASAESDDALLEDVNSEISASVPTPMQALDVPAVSTDTSDESDQTSTQRKD